MYSNYFIYLRLCKMLSECQTQDDIEWLVTLLEMFKYKVSGTPNFELARIIDNRVEDKLIELGLIEKIWHPLNSKE